MNIFRKFYCRAFQLVFKIAIPLLPYKQPKILQSVSDAARAMKGLRVKRAFIVTDAGVMSHGLCDGLTAALAGLLNKKIANVIIKECALRPSALCKEINDGMITRVASKIKKFTVTPYDTNGFENAQVCGGGVDLDGINMSTMESLKVKGLYFAGEMLDVDGRCGGYNLHWAFASGRLAGIKAAEQMITADGIKPRRIYAESML